MTLPTLNRSSLGKLRRWSASATARIHSFQRARRGATAVEFALVALPFLFLMLSLIELAMVFLVSTTLDNALVSAARGLKTGSSLPPNAAAFVTATCNNMGWLQSSCTSQLQVDVRTEAQFSNPTEPDPMASGTWNPAVITYNPGTPGEILLVRGFYQWPLFMPIVDAALSKANNGVAVIVSTTTFVVEPY